MTLSPYRSIDPSVACAAHPGVAGVESCETCGRRLCDECLTWDAEGLGCRRCRRAPARLVRRLVRPIAPFAGAAAGVGLAAFFLLTYMTSLSSSGSLLHVEITCDRAMLECAAADCGGGDSAIETARVERFFEHQCARTSIDYAHGAAALAGRARYRRAGELLDEAVQRFPRDPYAHHNRAEFLHRHMGIERALPDYAAAFDLAPEAFAENVASVVDREREACSLLDRTLLASKVTAGRGPLFAAWVARLEARCHPRQARARRPLSRFQQRLRLRELTRTR